MVQVRCPNCGGYRVADEQRHLNPWGGVMATGGRIAALMAVGAFCAVGGMVTAFSPSGNDSGTTASVLVIFGLILVAAGGVALLMQSNAVVRHQYICALCGYKWEWREDQPQPQATQPANTELIERGEQRLRNAAAAAAHEDQLRRERERRNR